MNKRGHNVSFKETLTKKHPKEFRDQETILDPAELENYLEDQDLIQQLKKNGFSKLFPIQQESFHTILKGRDLTARDRTGSGKTLAYSLPSLERLRRGKLINGTDPKVLIMVPTRELVIQVCSCFDKISLPSLGLKTVAVYGGDSLQRQLDNVKNGVDIIVATPGRLIDFINRGAIKFSDLKCLVLDEADEMLNKGFQTDIENIFRSVMKETDEKPQTLLFSATLPPWVKSISDKYQSPKTFMIDLVGNTQISIPKTIQHFKYSLANFHEMSNAVKKICHSLASSQGRCIIFCETKRDVNELYNDLKGEKCKMLHGDVKQHDRERIYHDFKTGKVLKIVATNVAARGLDFPDIELVIQVEPPRRAEEYIHRAGRTGRAGKKGTCVVMTQKKHRERLGTIESEGKFEFQELREKDLVSSNSNNNDNNYKKHNNDNDYDNDY